MSFKSIFINSFAMIALWIMRTKLFAPPLHQDFALPNKKQLLKLRSGDLVKLKFQVGSENVERMWVILDSCDSPDLWSGRIDSDSEQQHTAKILSAGTTVYFHPLDIIEID